jgi:hypothetical protein
VARWMRRISCLSHSSRRRLLWAVALPVSPLRISLAPGQCRVASPVEEVMGVVLLAEAFVVHPVCGGVGDRTANAIESILRRTGCSTLAVNFAKNGLDPSLCLHVLPANSHKSREPTSGLEPLSCCSYEFACVHTSPYWCVRKLRLFRGFWVIWGHHFVQCVPARISPVAVRLQ